MSAVVKTVLLVALTVAVAYFAPTLIPQIGAFFGASGFLATAIGTLVLAVGVSVLQYGISLIGRPQPSPADAGKVNVRIAEPPRWLSVGDTRQGGGSVFGDFDAAGNFWYVTVHSDSVLATTLQYFMEDIAITLDDNGYVTTNEFCLNDKKEPYEGTGTKIPYFRVFTRTYTADNPVPPTVPELTAACPQWTTDHVLAGTTYSVVMCKAIPIEKRTNIYKWSGVFRIGEPNLSIAGMWSKPYDPRTDTYAATNNPALIWAWFRTHRYGRNKPFDSVNWDRVAEMANICDQIVAGLNGSHKRYECGLSIPDNKERALAEQEILITADAQLSYDGEGKCWPRVGYYYAPTVKITRNRDVISMESVEAQNGESETQGVIVRYVDREANYTAQPSAAWLNPLYYVPGQPATFLTIDALGVHDHNQAMRLAKAIGMRSQPTHKIVPTVGLRGLRARQERIFNLNYDNTFAGDYEIVTPVEVDQAGIFCGFGCVPIDADRWTLLAGEEKPKPVITDYDAAPLPEMPTGVIFTFNNGRIEGSFTPPARADVGYQFEYIETPLVPSDQWLFMAVQMENNFTYTGPVQEGKSYSIRYRSVASSGRVSAYSTPQVVNVARTIAPANNLTVTGAVGSSNVSWKNPNDINFYYSDVYRGATNVFSAATKIVSNFAGGVGQVQAVTDTIAAGTYYYWVVARSSDGTSATPTGPVSGVVS